MRNYNARDPLSIYSYSGGLLGHSLAEIAPILDETVSADDISQDGKGGLGVLVEKHFFGYEPNSNPTADFEEAGVELKVSPLKKDARGMLRIKERLVCDMIDYFALADEEFETSAFFRKSMLMLIIFYLHINGCPKRDLRFIYSVLWAIKDKDLMIIKEDFRIIRDKVRRGLAHEISEGDTMYLGACRKGQKGQAPRKQPFSDMPANARAFSLKTAYMRTILDFVSRSGRDMASNLTEAELPGIELVSAAELSRASFDDILRARFKPFMGMDYKQIAAKLGLAVSPSEKSRYARVTKGILSKGMTDETQIEEFRKAGIKVKTIRLGRNGSVKEHMSFDKIDYAEVHETDHWTDSRWYEIVTTRYLFVVFREVDSPEWTDEPRFVLDRMFFWTMPPSDYPVAEAYWQNIRDNVEADTLLDKENSFWTLADRRFFHVRPKARNSADKDISPVSGNPVPKKAYWFDNRYLRKELIAAYGDDWETLFGKPDKNTDND